MGLHYNKIYNFSKMFIDMKFEKPKGILGNVPKAINSSWTKEYSERVLFIDLWLSLEQSIINLICKKIDIDFLKEDFLRKVILNKISFNDKISILKNICKEEDYLNKLEITFEKEEKKNGKNFLITKYFKIHFGSFIRIIEELRDVRNFSAHHDRPISYNGKIHIPKKDNPLEDNEMDREEFLIKSHFILWILYTIEPNSAVNKSLFIEYYHKYKDVLNFAELIEK